MSFCGKDLGFDGLDFLWLIAGERGAHLEFSSPGALALHEGVVENELAGCWAEGLEI